MTDVAGMPLTEGLPDGTQPLSAVTVMKCLDTDGSVAYYARATDDVTTVEALGMAHYLAQQLRDGLRGEDA